MMERCKKEKVEKKKRIKHGIVEHVVIVVVFLFFFSSFIFFW